MDTHFFSVPMRLVWDNWQKFNGEQKNPNDSTDFLFLSYTSNWWLPPNSLADYLGLPVSLVACQCLRSGIVLTT